MMLVTSLFFHSASVTSFSLTVHYPLIRKGGWTEQRTWQVPIRPCPRSPGVSGIMLHDMDSIFTHLLIDYLTFDEWDVSLFHDATSFYSYISWGTVWAGDECISISDHAVSCSLKRGFGEKMFSRLTNGHEIIVMFDIRQQVPSKSHQDHHTWIISYDS